SVEDGGGLISQRRVCLPVPFAVSGAASGFGMTGAGPGGGAKSSLHPASLEWVIRFTLGRRRPVAHAGVGSIKHRPGREDAQRLPSPSPPWGAPSAGPCSRRCP